MHALLYSEAQIIFFNKDVHHIKSTNFIWVKKGHSLGDLLILNSKFIRMPHLALHEIYKAFSFFVKELRDVFNAKCYSMRWFRPTHHITMKHRYQFVTAKWLRHSHFISILKVRGIANNIILKISVQTNIVPSFQMPLLSFQVFPRIYRDDNRAVWPYIDV